MNLRESFLGLADSYFVPYFPALDRITGDMKSSIFMYYIAFWMGKGADKRDLWVYKTQEELRRELNLSRYEQEAIRKNLRMRGLLEEKKMGVPSRLYFRLNVANAQKAWVGIEDIKEDEEFELAKRIVQEYGKEISAASSMGLVRYNKYVSYNEVLLERGAKCELCGDLIEKGPGTSPDSLVFFRKMKDNEVTIAHNSCGAGERMTYHAVS